VGGRRQSPAHHLKVGPSGTLHLVSANNIAGKGYDILNGKSNGPGDYSSSAPKGSGDLAFYSARPGTYEVSAALAQ
jgi:hypothetical protein